MITLTLQNVDNDRALSFHLDEIKEKDLGRTQRSGFYFVNNELVFKLSTHQTHRFGRRCGFSGPLRIMDWRYNKDQKFDVVNGRLTGHICL